MQQRIEINHDAIVAGVSTDSETQPPLPWVKTPKPKEAWLLQTITQVDWKRIKISHGGTRSLWVQKHNCGQCIDSC